MFAYDKSINATANALALSVKTVRKAQGRSDPWDYPMGTEAWQAEMEDFGRDVLAAIAKSAASMVAECDHVSRVS